VHELAHFSFAILSPRHALQESPFDDTFPGSQRLQRVPRAFGSDHSLQLSFVLVVVGEVVVFLTTFVVLAAPT
jgi:hypothetical protein